MTMSKKKIKLFNKSTSSKGCSPGRLKRLNSKTYKKLVKRREREDICWEVAFAVGNLPGGGLSKHKRRNKNINSRKRKNINSRKN